jgi:hypothetical protein
MWLKEEIKMKKIILLLLITPTFVFGAFPTIDVRNVNGDYRDEKGIAYAEKASYALPQIKISHSQIEFNFNKFEKSLIISDSSTTVELEFDFSFLNIFKAFSFTAVNIDSTDKIFNIQSEQLDLYIEPKKYHMSNISFFTDVEAIPTQDGQDISVIDGLILNAGLKIEKIEFEHFDEVVFDDLRVENPISHLEVKKIQNEKNYKLKLPMIIRKTNFTVKEGVFNGRAKVDSYINLWLRLGGKISTNKENTVIEVFLIKAKLGIFSIRKTVLKMVKRLNLEGVTVDGNKIRVDLATVSSVSAKALNKAGILSKK